MEKWILRSLLAGVALLSVTALLGSLDDIKRYARIKKM